MTPPDGVANAVAAQRTLVQRLLDEMARVGRAPAGLRADPLGTPGADPPGITRDAYGAGENAAQAIIAETARAIGLETRSDAACNLHMSWPGTDPGARRIALGSHLDSVVQGGNFDGAAGVIGALAAVSALRSLGVRPRAGVEVLALRCEEAVWFGLGLVGSRAALGQLPKEALARRRLGTDRTLAEHMRDCGGDPDAVAGGAVPIDPATLSAFVEIHIEQAPQLIEAGVPIAVCTGIPGNIRHPRIRILGEDAHVGLPRRFRRDAALAGADLALALDALWAEEEAAGRPMACTIGRFHTLADRHAMTVVPGSFELSLDLRAWEAARLAALERRLHGIVREVEARRGVTIRLGERNSGVVGPCDAAMAAALADCAARLGIAQHPLPSPASHDAANFAAAGVPTGMLLLRNRNGSHNPREAMETEDLMAAVSVLALWLVDQLAQT